MDSFSFELSPEIKSIANILPYIDVKDLDIDLTQNNSGNAWYSTRDGTLILRRNWAEQPPCPAINDRLERSVEYILSRSLRSNIDISVLEASRTRLTRLGVSNSWVGYNTNVLLEDGSVINCDTLFFTLRGTTRGISISLSNGNIEIFVTGCELVGYTIINNQIYVIHNYSCRSFSDKQTAAIGLRKRIGKFKGYEAGFNRDLAQILFELFEEASQTDGQILIESGERES